ncbi:hypothetical protein ACFL27_01575 [candidate division CSSED10-310 bacterium]|uniref:Glycosyltransferase RgtA/B/C/D-like domain-containing protein n=1 Tax=candidate division CSSED10-310 bacterium TaxID=2855610 RepID=A0ABV6YRP1_UNCC1
MAALFKKQDLAVVIAIVSFLFVPLITCITRGMEGIFCFLAGDSFYYLTIAQNFLQFKILSFDQSSPTNCFHPLWQLITILMTFFADAKNTVLITLFISNLVISTSGILIFWFTVRKKKLHYPMFLAIFPCGLYFLIDTTYHNLWAYLNGLETSLFLFFYIIFSCYIFLQNNLNEVNPSSRFYLSLLITLIIFTRLDSLFLLPSLVIFGVFLSYRDASVKWLKNVYFIVAFPSIALLLYLLFSYFYFGNPIPVSAALKSTFPALNRYNFKLIYSEISGANFSYFGRLWISQLLVPLMFSIIILIYEIIHVRNREICGTSAILLITAMFNIFIHLYNLLFVTIHHQGNWYYVISVFFIYFSVFLIFERDLTTIRKNIKLAINIILLVIIIYATVQTSYRHLTGTEPYSLGFKISKTIYDERMTLRECIKPEDGKVYAIDDGLFAFGTDLPTISGTGICLDCRGNTLRKKGDLRKYLKEIGITHVFIPRYYLSSLGKEPNFKYADLGEVSKAEIDSFVSHHRRWLGPLKVKKQHRSYVLFEVE